MSNNPLPFRIGTRSMEVRLVFAIFASTIGLVLTLTVYWLASMEPRLRENAEAAAGSLAQAHGRNLAAHIVDAAQHHDPEPLQAVLDEIMLISDPVSNEPFVQAIALDVDEGVVGVAPGLLDLRRGDCATCFIHQIALYSADSGEMLGVATFFSTKHFYEATIKDVRTKLLLACFIAFIILAITWGLVVKLFGQVRANELAAHAAAKAKADFLAAMSHEIRTPMNGIMGMIHLLQRSALDGQQADYINTLAASGQNLLTVLDDVLDFSRIEAGRMTILEQPYELRELMNGVRNLMLPRAQELGLSLTVEVADDVPAWILGDAVRMRQVLLNLVGNALKFTDQGSVRMTVERRATSELAWLEVAVVDTGMGIEPERQFELFEPFTQAETGRTRRYGGTGLGLAICKQLVELMGGLIGLRSTVGRGSTFYFRIPCREAAPAAAAAAPGPAADAVKRPLRILVVDDDPINRRAATLLLQANGHRCTPVSDGLGAIEAVSTGGFDLVLMDVHMPEMDGLTATRAIRAMTDARAQVPIIGLSADILPEEQRACLDAGMDAFIGKPFDPRRLETVMQTIVSGRAPGSASVDVQATEKV